MVIVLKKSDSKRIVNKKLKTIKPSKPIKPFNAKKYNGIIKLKEDPLIIQKQMRDE